MENFKKVFRVLIFLFSAGVCLISLFAFASMIIKGGYETMEIVWTAARMVVAGALVYYMYTKRFKQ
jgi:hypothetical protein